MVKKARSTVRKEFFTKYENRDNEILDVVQETIEIF